MRILVSMIFLILGGLHSVCCAEEPLADAAWLRYLLTNTASIDNETVREAARKKLSPLSPDASRMAVRTTLATAITEHRLTMDTAPDFNAIVDLIAEHHLTEEADHAAVFLDSTLSMPLKENPFYASDENEFKRWIEVLTIVSPDGQHLQIIVRKLAAISFPDACQPQGVMWPDQGTYSLDPAFVGELIWICSDQILKTSLRNWATEQEQILSQRFPPQAVTERWNVHVMDQDILSRARVCEDLLNSLWEWKRWDIHRAKIDACALAQRPALICRLIVMGWLGNLGLPPTRWLTEQLRGTTETKRQELLIAVFPECLKEIPVAADKTGKSIFSRSQAFAYAMRDFAKAGITPTESQILREKYCGQRTIGSLISP